MSNYARSTGEKIFNVINIIFFILLSITMIFPMWNVLMTSLVEVGEFIRRPIILWPEKISLLSYQYIFSTPIIVNSIFVSVFITVVGTLYNLIITTQIAYTLSKKDLPGRNFILGMHVVTMFFGGGLIPTYLWVKSLGLFNTIWSVIIPTGVSVWNLAVMKSFFNQLPAGLEESAKLDGANDLIIFYKIVVPVSMPLFATFTLFYAVGHWNSWYSAMLYIQDRYKQPLALVLRQMLVSSNLPPEIQALTVQQKFGGKRVFLEGVNAAAIIVATVPILGVYPWLQKYFTKGVMVGSLKG